MNDDKLGKWMSNKLDEELEAIVFSPSAMEQVNKRLKKKNWISRLLNYEVEIPLSKVIMGVSVIVFAVVLITYETVRITPENMQHSQIEYIEITADR